MSEWARQSIGAVLRKRAENGGRHLHHRDCIHNLPPERQIEMRGKTVEWWSKFVGALPEQITPDQWQTEPPDLPPYPSLLVEPLTDDEGKDRHE